MSVTKTDKEVRFIQTTSADYAAQTEIISDAIYFLTDTQEIYVGSTKYAQSVDLKNGTGAGSVMMMKATASGSYAFAEGSSTIAAGANSHAEGIYAEARGDYSHAEGNYTLASGDYSHTEGAATKASSNASHAEGASTRASGAGSHAEGMSTTASGSGSHAEGSTTTAVGSYSHAEGNNTDAGLRVFSVETFTQASSSFVLSSVDGLSAEMTYSLIISGQLILSCGSITSVDTTNNTITVDTYPDDAPNAVYIFIEADKSLGDTVLGEASHAEGNTTTALGTASHAEGGNSTTASGEYAHAEGSGTTASSNASHAEGASTRASGAGSHAEGGNTKASGYASHAEGGSTNASGHYSHAEGISTTASGDDSHAEGSSTIAEGSYSHAEGNNTRALDTASHAEGSSTTASGGYSHAEGNSTIASGIASHAQGKYNIEDSSNIYADIIGNGTNSSTRSNAATVDWSGNAWYAGDVYVGSTSGTNKDEGSRKLATEEYVDSASEKIANQVTPEAYGAKGDGATDDTDSITQALASSQNVVFDGTKTYLISSTITIPAGAYVDFRGATIIPAGDHDVIRVMPGAYIENLVVKCTDVAGWDSSAIVLYGGDRFSATDPTKICNVKLYNNTGSTAGLTTLGNGFKLYGDKSGHYIEGITVEEAMTYGFGNGMLFVGVDNDLGNTTGLIFIGANKFRGYWSYYDHCGINMDVQYPNTHITNNIFTDLQIEPRTGQSSYGIYCGGFTNYFEGCLYDYFYEHTAIYFTKAANRNVVRLTDSQVLAAAFLEDFGTCNTVVNLYQERKDMLPHTATTPNVIGDQDDALAFMDKRSNCTLESLDGDPVSGGISSIFNPTSRVTLRYRALNPATNNRRAIITINCKTALQRVAIFFLQFYQAPKSVKVTFYNNVDATVVYDTDNNANDLVEIFSVAKYGESIEYNVAKIVIELGGFNSIFNEGAETYGEWELVRIGAVDSYNTGNTWMRRDGGEVYGNIKFAENSGPVLTDANGKRYLLTVSTDGSLGTVEVPDEDEEAPEVAVLTPTMAAGATWYDADLAGAAQDTITSIAFNAAYESTGSEDASWACDEDRNGNIMAYRNGTEVVIKSTTGSEGVKLNVDSSYMFANDGTNANFAALSSVTGTETLRADKNTSIAGICQKNTVITSPISIPNGVTDMKYAFSGCYKLATPPVLPDGLLSLLSAFGDCIGMQYLPEIPSTVTNLNYAFQSCSAATSAPSEVPAAVTSMINAFRNCVKISGTIEVNAEAIGAYSGAFDNTGRDSDGVVLTGSSPYLEQLAATNTIGKVTVAT